MRINLISRHNPNTDIKGLKPGFRLVSNTPSWHYQPAGPMMYRSSLGCTYTLIFILCGPCRQEQRQTYQHLWQKTPPSHPLSVYVFLSPTISSLPSFVPSCQCCAKEPSPFSLTHLSCPFMMVSPFLILSLSLFLSSSSLLDFLHPHHLWVPLSSPPPLSIPPLLSPPPPRMHTKQRKRLFFFSGVTISARNHRPEGVAGVCPYFV